MQAVIPAAGRGARLGGLTEFWPKPLVQVAGQPLLAHGLRSLEPLCPSEVIIVVGYKAEAVRDRFGDRWRDLPLTYVRQPGPEGLARALLAAESSVHGDFMVLYADNVVRADLAAPVRMFGEQSLDALIVTKDVPPEDASQGVCLTDAAGRLVRVVEYPDAEQRKAGRIMTGFAVFSPVIFDACRQVEPSEAEEYELPDAINVLLATGARVGTIPLDGDRINVNTLDDISRAERLLAD